MKTRKLGQELTVSAIGLGCMGMSYAYGGQEEQDAIRTLHRAFDLGITFFDTAEVYGPYENEKLLGKALKPFRDKVTIATKFGFKIEDGKPVGVDSRPENIRAVAEASLKRLDIETIDLFYQHRVDPTVPIEDVIGTMKDLINEGKIRTIGLSEAGVKTIRRAHAVHPIAALQNEYSLWTRDPEQGVLALCAELGIGFVPYSPLGRGMLTGQVRSQSDLAEGDFRKTLPRFQPGNLEANNKQVDLIAEIAREKQVTPAQLALAWVLNQGNFIVPIPGARKINHLEDNAKAVNVTLTTEELERLNTLFDSEKIAGKRYTEASLAMTGL
ncbi:aldo/keto reductase [Ochrobactrum sp. MYb15]|uniref:aldo/keto reductase n=1 Tax=Brucella TaxID=234 RepID=UPI0001C8766E|nr:aldo/keto reductase [Brucella rhizosphaerae]PQZ48989.1 aldo/keto reductase [Ochrobactrum sp. MYb19]PRA57806.1 aldo/keto reductase [Ochrobactrum sp. MYb68]PRA67193.1 aldo/keto reductase [Ochrobactrum sp. MYb18]PRA77847.1 aldo/keto reductase [Brucella thiophenivorans]PRA92204.1 aldo/keto reductase [Ochrobactrum sp. MYb14]PRA99857.1 aldo/keto reductase [Ochrobactrum sp. MYb15]